MTDRERFEAWARDQDEIFGLSRSLEGSYKDCAAFVAWDAWQASRKQALSDFLALLAPLSDKYDFGDGHWLFLTVLEMLEGDVRNLANPEGEQG